MRIHCERGAVMAIVLMVLGSVLLMTVMAAKFTDVAVPGFTKAKVSTNETAAIASLRVINGSQLNYSTSCASGGFAVSLEDLARPPIGQDVPFVSSDLGKNGIEKNGYKLTRGERRATQRRRNRVGRVDVQRVGRPSRKLLLRQRRADDAGHDGRPVFRHRRPGHRVFQREPDSESDRRIRNRRARAVARHQNRTPNPMRASFT